MQRLWVGLAVVVLAVGCIAHEKNGDSAAAVGDWRQAYYEYGQALEGDTKNVPLQEKYQRAKTEALEQATQKAQSCATTADWNCALEQADFALSIDSSSKDMANLRVAAAKAVALGLVNAGRDEGSRANYPKAFELLGKAVATSKDPEVTQAALEARGQVLRSLDADVDRLRSQQNYAQAIPLLELATRVDGSHRARLDNVRQEYSAFLETQYEQRAQAGDAALKGKRWNEAVAAYQAALGIHPGGRAEPLLRYATSVAQAEQAASREDFRTATASYRDAVATGLDRDGYANSMLQRVEIRPYVIRLRSVLVYPFRLSGLPWGGRRDPSIEQLLRVAAVNAYPRPGEPASEQAISTARALPLEFAPVLQAEALVPERGLLVTGPVRGFYTVFDASFVAFTNSFDTRPVQFRVRHIGGGAEEAGSFGIPLRDLVATGRIVVADRAVARFEVIAEPANGMPPDALIGWGAPPPSGPGPGYNGPPPPGYNGPPGPGYNGPPPPGYNGPSGPGYNGPPGSGYNGPPGPPPPPPGVYPGRLRVAEIGVRLGREDIPLRRPGLPSPAVELYQGDRLVFRVQADRVVEGQWAPAGLHVNPAERLHIRAFDVASGTPVLVLDTWVDPPAMQSGVFETQTPRGSWLRVRFGRGGGSGHSGPP